MCALNLQKNEAADTDIVFGPLCDVAKLLRGYIPCGKVALIADGESNFPAVQTIRAALKGFECFWRRRGRRRQRLGAFFPSRRRARRDRGGERRVLCGAVFLHPQGRVLYRRARSCGSFRRVRKSRAAVRERRLFPLPADAPDAVYCDLSRYRARYDAAYGKLCLCALSAFDCEAHSVFAGQAATPPRRITGSSRTPCGSPISRGRIFKENCCHCPRISRSF